MATPVINEKSTANLNIQFQSNSAEVFTITAVEYRIDHKASGTEIRDWTSMTPGNEISIFLTELDTTMVRTGAKSEIHEVTIRATYGAGGKVTSSYLFEVRNLKFLT